MDQIKKGPDVSEHQGIINWDKSKADGIDFVMIRCGYVSDIASQDDKQFEFNVSECDRLGIPWGAYLYSYALTVDHAKSEAAHALRLLNGKKPIYPISFDMEDADGYKAKNGMPSNNVLVDICDTFLSTLESQGYKVVLYSNLNWLNNQLNDSKLDKYDKWVAEWGPQCTYGKSYCMWQYTDAGTVNGINGNVDMNYCYCDYSTVNQPTPQPQPSPSPNPPSGSSIIRTIQSTLNSRYGLNIAVDGIFGPQTRQALLKGFQIELNRQFNAGLVVDGIWGPNTKAACPLIQKGARGNITWILQALLYCHGYDPKGLDGIFGNNTASAVLAFQQAEGLIQDAIAGKNTFEKLFTA
jgi:GH25 family lysozyme M1 (1,4-beta-N-acetylmuramidase)